MFGERACKGQFFSRIAMEIKDRVAVVTGGCSGIGAALARRFRDDGARAVIVADLVIDHPPEGTTARHCDVTREQDIAALVADAERDFSRIDIFCSNAGVFTPGWDVRALDPAAWQRDWGVNVMAHALAAKAVLPGMIARGEGYLLQTLSAAGLLASPESVAYTTTKHAAMGLAEFLAFSYRRFGIRVSALCPMAVRTPLLEGLAADGASAGLDGVVTADEVADAAVAGMLAERFLILPHPRVADYYAKKAGGHDKWLRQMEALQERFTDARSS
jgi:NAD(P)-dependent dehydrogenase (short-subunit alcohol dehydrogenase family)